MNAALRGMTRAALALGAEVFGIREGWHGVVTGGELITPLGWDDVSGILHRGGTVLGTARSAEFRTRDGLRDAVYNLVKLGIDRLVVIGGDGSLSGADELRDQWSSLLAELIDQGKLDPQATTRYPALILAGLVGSIDNDLVGFDSTIGSDSALHRIIDAIDAIGSTAASHHRSFVIEVMGRRCGYLALLASIAGGCDAVFVPEKPPGVAWRDELCDHLRNARASGRRDSIVVVAEGAVDQNGESITAHQVRDAMDEGLGEESRVTILGHVQRGGSPSAYDRWMGTALGVAAARTIVSATHNDKAVILGVHRNAVVQLPLREAVDNTRSANRAIDNANYDAAVAARGETFHDLTMVHNALTEPPRGVDASGRTVALIHGGGLAPGMNTAIHAAAKLALGQGHRVLGVTNGFTGLRDGTLHELRWADIDGWHAQAGAVLGALRTTPQPAELFSIARTLEEHHIDAVILVGGVVGYDAIATLATERERYPHFDIPMVCIPATIDNNIPGTDLTIGADTALNTLVTSLDHIKQSASANRRVFVVETMGRECGYLALMSALASGAERAYLPERPVTMSDLERDAHEIVALFTSGREFYLVLRNEFCHTSYTTEFMAQLFDGESNGLYDVRHNTIGHTQQGGTPTPFDRVLATRLAWHAITELGRQFDAETAHPRHVAFVGGHITVNDLTTRTTQPSHRHTPWWLALTDTLDLTAGRNYRAGS